MKESNQKYQEMTQVTISSLRRENAEMARQIDESHTQRARVQKEFKKAS